MNTAARITPPLLVGALIINFLIPSSVRAETTEHIICPATNASTSGSSSDEYALAQAYDKGTCGIASNQKLALQWYKHAAEHGSMLAQYQLGEIYYIGKYGVFDYPEAKKWYIAAAKQGDGDAQWRLGFLSVEGHYKGLTVDLSQGEYWWSKAAAQNADDAQFRLGNFYHNYKNPPDYKDALYWLTKAAEGGNRTAMFDLARMIKDGEGTPKDPEKALYWMTKAAEADMPMAEMMLSEMYANGDGAPKDVVQSLTWTLKVADAPSAIPYWIDKAADIFFDGWDILPKNYPRAFKLYQRAAAKDDPHAQARLGLMYMKGLGVEADPVKAREYLSKAGDPDSKALLSQLKK